jgi:hypothetical protein
METDIPLHRYRGLFALMKRLEDDDGRSPGVTLYKAGPSSIMFNCAPNTCPRQLACSFLWGLLVGWGELRTSNGFRGITTRTTAYIESIICRILPVMSH